MNIWQARDCFVKSKSRDLCAKQYENHAEKNSTMQYDIKEEKYVFSSVGEEMPVALDSYYDDDEFAMFDEKIKAAKKEASNHDIICHKTFTERIAQSDIKSFRLRNSLTFANNRKKFVDDFFSDSSYKNEKIYLGLFYSLLWEQDSATFTPEPLNNKWRMTGKSKFDRNIAYIITSFCDVPTAIRLSLMNKWWRKLIMKDIAKFWSEQWEIIVEIFNQVLIEINTINTRGWNYRRGGMPDNYIKPYIVETLAKTPNNHRDAVMKVYEDIMAARIENKSKEKVSKTEILGHSKVDLFDDHSSSQLDKMYDLPINY